MGWALLVQGPRRSGLRQYAHGACAAVRRAGCVSTHMAAAKISAKPIMSSVVGRSPSINIELETPTTGVASEPSEAVAVGKRSIMANHRI